MWRRHRRVDGASLTYSQFYFKMLSGRNGPGTRLSRGKKWTGTVDGDRGNRAMDVDTVRLLKTQDMQYMRTVRNHAVKEVRTLEERAILATSLSGGGERQEEYDDDDEQERVQWRPARPNKIVFAYPGDDDNGENAEMHDADKGDLEGSRDGDSGAAEVEDDEAPTTDRQAEKAARLRRKLHNAKKRLKALTDAERGLDMQRARMAKTATVGGITKRGKTFKIRERKR